jgi:hypothetical protein
MPGLNEENQFPQPNLVDRVVTTVNNRRSGFVAPFRPAGTPSGGVMAIGWFQKATGVFGRRESEPQPFELPCDCGVILTGFRTETPQKPVCPACGTVNFVLPVCQFPVPASVRRVWLGEEEPPPPKKAADPSPRTRPASKTHREKERVPDEAPPVELVPRPSWGERLRSAATPVRLVLLTIVVTVALTGLLMLQGARKEWARTHLRPAIDRGFEALEDRSFSTASSAFEEACLALDRLGRRDPAALAVRQLRQEVDVAARLSSSSLAELLDQVTVAKKDDDVAERFQEQAAGEWFVFDAVVQPDAKRPESCFVDVPLLLGGQPLDVAFDGVPWPRYWKQSESEGPRRMVFAAQLDRLEFSGGKSRRVTLMLRSETAMLWCHVETYQAVVLSPLDADQEASVREVLQSQREALGVGDVP